MLLWLFPWQYTKTLSDILEKKLLNPHLKLSLLKFWTSSQEQRAERDLKVVSDMMLLSWHADKLCTGGHTIVGFVDWGGGGGKGEAAEEAGVLTLLLALLAGDAGEAGCVVRPLGGGGRPDGGGDGAFRPCISAASFSSVALRSATRSAMSASKSVSSSSWRDSGVRNRIILSRHKTEV